MGVTISYIIGILIILSGCKTVATTLIKVVNFRNKVFETTDKYTVRVYHIVREWLKEVSFIVIIIVTFYGGYKENMNLMENGTWRNFGEYSFIANMFYLLLVGGCLYLAAFAIAMMAMRFAYVTKESIIVFGPLGGEVPKDKVKSCVLMRSKDGDCLFRITYSQIMKNTFVVSDDIKWEIRDILLSEYNAVEEDIRSK